MSLEARILAVVQAIAADIKSLITGKQATLVSNTNLKTVNAVTLLGSGDITIINDATNTTTTTWSSTKLNTTLGDISSALTTINGI